MHRRDFLAASAGVAAARGQLAARRPNIVFIMADDLGYGDLGCYGQHLIATPNIDRMASEGMRFTQAYAGSTVCAPSRCSLMTGKHMGHATVRGNRNPEVPLRPDDVTVAEIAKMAGYRTAQFGKWGVGGPVTLGRPNTQGFDEFFGYLSQWHAHNNYPEHLWDNEAEFFIADNRSGLKGTFSQDLFMDRALKFLDRSTENPFFLYLPFTLPHANNELGSATGDGMEVPDYGSYANRDWPKPEKGQAAMVQMLDRDVGRVLDRLKKLGIDQNTLVFFTSDNGPHQEGGHKADFFTSAGPLRGMKRDLYEGGIRVPMIARWPAAIRAGQTSDTPWAFWDLLPTVADLTGVPAPEGIDGVSIANSLTGGPQQKREYFYWEFHERGFDQALRMGDWKAVRKGYRGEIELYDLAADIGERNDLAARHPDIVKRVSATMASARSESPEFPIKKL